MNNKKWLCLLFVVVLLGAGNLFGIIVGVGSYTTKLTSLYSNVPTMARDSRYVTGFQVGIDMPISISASRNFYIQPGVYYVRKGGDLTIGDLTYEKTKFDLRYIQVPLLLKYKIRNLYFLAGGFGAFNVRARLTNYINNIKGQPVDIKDSVKSMNFGLIGGIGFEVNIGNRTQILIESRYEKSLTYVFNSLLFYGSQDWGKSNAVSFLLGFKF